MKTNIIFLFLITLLLSGGLVTSCYEDDSSLNIKDIGSVDIDTTGMSTLSVYQFETLEVNPTINISGVSESDLVYKWRIQLGDGARDTTFTVIGTEKNLSYDVRLAPNEGNDFYILTLTVTDMLHNLDYMMDWKTTVKNPLGEGLVIAETNDDENTDLSIIMAPEVTEGYTDNKILRHVYSANNGGSIITGNVKQMRVTVLLRKNILFSITDNSLVKVETSDYSYAGMNDDLFYAAKSSYKPQMLGYVPQGDIYVGENQLTSTYLGITEKLGLPFDFDFEVPDHVAMNPRTGMTVNVVINFYDESLGGFVYLPSVQSFGDHNMHAYTPVSGAVFNPASLPNKINLAANTNLEAGFLHLLKDKTSGDIALYVFDKAGYVSPDIIPPAPKAVYDFSSAPDIESAKFFVLLDNQKVMFYATGTKIYAALYGGITPVFEERYTVPAGEEITTLQVYHQAGSAPTLSTDNTTLVMSTYSDQGKVYLLPYKNLGAANIDTDNIKVFEGFDKITAITSQQ